MRNVVNDGFRRGAGAVLAGWLVVAGVPGFQRPSTDDEVIRGHDDRVWNPCAPWPLVL